MIIGFIGLGKFGMPCAEAVAQKRHDVLGYDVATVSSNTVKIKSTIEDCVK